MNYVYNIKDRSMNDLNCTYNAFNFKIQWVF